MVKGLVNSLPLTVHEYSLWMIVLGNIDLCIQCSVIFGHTHCTAFVFVISIVLFDCQWFVWALFSHCYTLYLIIPMACIIECYCYFISACYRFSVLWINLCNNARTWCSLCGALTVTYRSRYFISIPQSTVINSLNRFFRTAPDVTSAATCKQMANSHLYPAGFAIVVRTPPGVRVWVWFSILAGIGAMH